MTNKTWIILVSEFWRRVRSTTFAVMTFLVPILFLTLMIAPTVLREMAGDSETRTVAVLDETGQLADAFGASDDDGFVFEATTLPEDSLRAHVRAGRIDGYLHVPATMLRDTSGTSNAFFYSTESGGLTTRRNLDTVVERVVRTARLESANASPAVLRIVRADVDVETRKLVEGGATEDNTLFLTIAGYLTSFAIFMAVLFYGQFVMQGIIEEKANRVVEVVVSSVRPVELLLGKVLGIGAMGLLQFTVWTVFIFGGLSMASMVSSLFFGPATPSAESAFTFPSLPPEVAVWFLLFFLTGYLLYAGLFAAVGSGFESPQDAQSATFVVMGPLFLSIVFSGIILEAPNTSLSVVLSLIPFFTPVLMMIRMVVTDVPLWQSVLSLVLVGGAFTATIWLGARIYRVGIFMYGKKPSLSEIIRWASLKQ